MEPLLSFVKEQLKGLNHNEMLFYSNLVFRFLDRTFSILLPFFLKTIESQCQKRISPKTIVLLVKRYKSLETSFLSKLMMR